MSRKCTLVTAFVLSLTFPLTGAALARSARPDMQLRVSTHSGPMPLTLTLTGSIARMDPAEFDACLLTVEWRWTTDAGNRMNSKKELPCADLKEGEPVPTDFKKEVTLADPGTYNYRIVLQRKDGKRMASTSQEVKVYRGGMEIGLTGGHARDRR